MVYGYCRVSTRGQARDGNGLEVQRAAVIAAGAEKVFSDTFTGTKANRPELNNLLDEINKGDKLIVAKLDRVARSASQGAELIQTLLDKGVTVHILNMGILDNTPTGKLIRMIFLAFAEFERDMIVERTQEGKALARQNPNFVDGRPKKFKKQQVSLALELLDKHSYKEVEQMTGISKSTLVRAKRKVELENERCIRNTIKREKENYIPVSY